MLESDCCSEPVSYAVVEEDYTSGFVVEVFDDSDKSTSAPFLSESSNTSMTRPWYPFQTPTNWKKKKKKSPQVPVRFRTLGKDTPPPLKKKKKSAWGTAVPELLERYSAVSSSMERPSLALRRGYITQKKLPEVVYPFQSCGKEIPRNAPGSGLEFWKGYLKVFQHEAYLV